MNKPIAYILCGAPGSGKSTYGKKLVEKLGIEKLCPDEFRAKFGRNENDQSVSGKAFDETKRLMDIYLSEGKSVIIDATNMYKKTRKQFIDIAKKYNATTIALVFEADKQTLIQRNQMRGAQGGRNVPENIIDNMIAKYERPDESELDKVEFISKL